MVLVSVVLAGASLLGQYLRFFHGIDSTFENLDVEEEANFPTYYNTLLLLAAAFVLATIARLQRLAGDPMSTRWTVLSVIFLVLSMDEAVGIHEESGRLMPEIGVLGGALTGWVAPAGVAVVIAGLYFIPFFRDLRNPHRLRFAASACVYVAGAFVVELAENAMVSTTNGETWRYQLVATLQEILEMVGVSLFIWALLKFIESREPLLRAAVHVGNR
jgi:hypothetical protein